MISPVVLIDELPWNQLNGDGELTLHCEDDYLRGVEDGMRKLLWRWKHCPGDLFVDPYYYLGRVIYTTDNGINGREGETREQDKGNNVISRRIKDQLSSGAVGVACILKCCLPCAFILRYVRT